MKLRNKKTGELLEDVKYIDTSLTTIEIHYLDNGVLRMETEKDYHSFLQDWEDADGMSAPSMPLIKDEAKRSVFKAWAETLGRDLEKADFKYDAERNSFNCYIADSTIEFANGEGINCVDREIYTFRALCGEEEV